MEMMRSVFDMLLVAGSDTDIPSAGLIKARNTALMRIAPRANLPLGTMKTSTVMSVMQGIMYYMSEEGFTLRGIAISDDSSHSIIGGVILTVYH